MKIFVAGLPLDLDDAELEEIFEKFGTVLSAKVVLDRMTKKSRGFGFVEMPVTEEAKEAIDGLTGIVLGRRQKPLVLKEAENNAASGTGGFRRTGGNDSPTRFSTRVDNTRVSGRNRRPL